MCDQLLGPRVDELYSGLQRTTKQTLPRLYAQIWAQTEEDPRDTNGDGRRPVSQDVSVKQVCSQHRYEAITLPLALHYMWPRSLDSDALSRRAMSDLAFQTVLAVYDNPEASVLFNKQESVYRPSRVMQTIRSRLAREAQRTAG